MMSLLNGLVAVEWSPTAEEDGGFFIEDLSIALDASLQACVTNKATDYRIVAICVDREQANLAVLKFHARRAGNG